ncbi:MAG TPA: alpha/beta hydrolase-fold protein [Gemmataceae bacterium]|nr:alpha/beta hydrolase-fold protein [Gemmataceae bacterium]
MNGAWTDITLAGKTVEVYDPKPGARPRFGVLFLHPLGLETLRDRRAYTEIFDKLNLVCLCPHGQRSWWVNRVCGEFDPGLTPEKHLLDNVLPHFQERWQLHPRSIGIFGISMGGQGALRLAFRRPDLFPVCAGIASAIDFHEMYYEGTPLDGMYDSKEHARQDTAVLQVHPSQFPPQIYFCCDPDDVRWHRGNDRLHEKLTALGIPHTLDLTTQAGGHSWQYFDRMAEPTLRFVYEGLEKESRRLL